MVLKVFLSVLNSTGAIYIRYFHSIEDVLRPFVVKKLQYVEWSYFKAYQNTKIHTITIISTKDCMIGKVKQVLSDYDSSIKRLLKDEMFSILNYKCLN